MYANRIVNANKQVIGDCRDYFLDLMTEEEFSDSLEAVIIGLSVNHSIVMENLYAEKMYGDNHIYDSQI